MWFDIEKCKQIQEGSCHHFLTHSLLRAMRLLLCKCQSFVRCHKKLHFRKRKQRVHTSAFSLACFYTRIQRRKRQEYSWKKHPTPYTGTLVTMLFFSSRVESCPPSDAGNTWRSYTVCRPWAWPHADERTTPSKDAPLRDDWTPGVKTQGVEPRGRSRRTAAWVLEATLKSLQAQGPLHFLPCYARPVQKAPGWLKGYTHLRAEK